MRDVVVAGAVRTPIGNLGGSLASLSAVQLGSVAIRAAVERAELFPADIQEVIMGHVLQACCGLNPARQALLQADLPVTVPGYTVNKVCASGMKSIALGALSVASGELDIVVAGGMESMSNAPYLLAKARSGYRLGDGELLDAVLRDALVDPTIPCHMGITAENLANEYSISRREQDVFAVESHRRAHAAASAGLFDAEIIPVEVPQRRGAPVVMSKDEFIKPDSTVEVLSGLKPAFTEGGTVTAGNASGVNDGAAALVLLSEGEARRRHVRPVAKIVGWASTALEPQRMGMGPVGAINRLFERTGVRQKDIDLVELNEAFAAQTIAVLRETRFDPGIVNVRGGAISLGHPVGCTGARIVVTLLGAMISKQARLGLAALCVGGGQGMACLVELL